MKPLILALSIFLSVVSANAGFETGNGGDGYASEFVLMGKVIAGALMKVDQPNPQLVDPMKLLKAISETEVHTVERLKLNGKEVDGVNYPSHKLICINHQRWSMLRLAPHYIPRVTLVLHEYLGVMGLDDSQYRLSLPLVALLNLEDEDLTPKREVENPVNDILVTMYDNVGEVCSDANMSFDVDRKREKVSTFLGHCTGRFRNVTVQKTTSSIETAKGMSRVATFKVRVTDESNQVVETLVYQPTIKSCDSRVNLCYLSGDVAVGDVIVKFLYRLN